MDALGIHKSRLRHRPVTEPGFGTSPFPSPVKMLATNRDSESERLRTALRYTPAKAQPGAWVPGGEVLQHETHKEIASHPGQIIK